jgi:prevent-host-death family protein
MPQHDSERKHEDAATAPSEADNQVTMVVARDLLGDLVNRARLMGTRTILSRNGKPVAAIVPIADYEKLTAA